MVKISIVTPSYNQGQFIADAIESVSNQDYPDKEHIIVDAMSTDETLDVIKSYAHLPHLRWVSEPDNGQSDAINKGFKMATGDVIAWLNADDYYLPQTFSKIADAFKQNHDAGIIYGNAMMVNQNKEALRVKKDHLFDRGVLLYYGCYIQSTTTFFRREIIDANHLIDSSYKLCMDYEYFVRLSTLGYCFQYTPETLAAFRWHETNLSVLYPQRRREETVKIKHQYGYKITENYQLQTFLHDLTYFFFLGKRQILKKLSI